MEISIIILLIVFILLAIWGFYFGFIRPIKPDFFFYFQTLNQAVFVFSTFFMIPFLIIALYLQATATDRLAETGILPHPSIEESVGIANGITKIAGIGIMNNPTWIFKVKAPPEEIMAFYHNENNRPGWELVSDNKITKMLILKRGKQRMTIAIHKDWTSKKLIYMLTNKDR